MKIVGRISYSSVVVYYSSCSTKVITYYHTVANKLTPRDRVCLDEPKLAKLVKNEFSLPCSQEPPVCIMS